MRLENKVGAHHRRSDRYRPRHRPALRAGRRQGPDRRYQRARRSANRRRGRRQIHPLRCLQLVGLRQRRRRGRSTGSTGCTSSSIARPTSAAIAMSARWTPPNGARASRVSLDGRLLRLACRRAADRAIGRRGDRAYRLGRRDDGRQQPRRLCHGQKRHLRPHPLDGDRPRHTRDPRQRGQPRTHRRRSPRSDQAVARNAPSS